MWPGLCLSAGPCPRSGGWTADPAPTACVPPPGCPRQSSWPALWAAPRRPPPAGSGSHLARSEVDARVVTLSQTGQKKGWQVLEHGVFFFLLVE